MSEDTTKEDKILEELASMDIVPKNVYHVTLLSGQEFIAELIPERRKSKSKDLIFMYPIKLYDDSYNEYSEDKIIVAKWNETTDQPYIPINPNSVTSIVPVNKEYMALYAYGVKINYFFDMFIEEQNILAALEKLKKEIKTPSNNISNVIEFSKYKKKINK